MLVGLYRAIARALLADDARTGLPLRPRRKLAREVAEIPFQRKIEMRGEIFDLVRHHDDFGMLGERALQPRGAAFRRADDEEVGPGQVAEPCRVAVDAGEGELAAPAQPAQSLAQAKRQPREALRGFVAHAAH